MEHIVKPVFMEQWYVTLVLFLIPYFVIGWDIMYKAVRNISHGQVFDENFLMLIATIGAFVVGEYSEGVAVMLFIRSVNCSRVMQSTVPDSLLRS